MGTSDVALLEPPPWLIGDVIGEHLEAGVNVIVLQVLTAASNCTIVASVGKAVDLKLSA